LLSARAPVNDSGDACDNPSGNYALREPTSLLYAAPARSLTRPAGREGGFAAGLDTFFRNRYQHDLPRVFRSFG